MHWSTVYRDVSREMGRGWGFAALSGHYYKCMELTGGDKDPEVRIPASPLFSTWPLSVSLFRVILGIR